MSIFKFRFALSRSAICLRFQRHQKLSGQIGTCLGLISNAFKIRYLSMFMAGRAITVNREHLETHIYIGISHNFLGQCIVCCKYMIVNTSSRLHMYTHLHTLCSSRTDHITCIAASTPLWRTGLGPGRPFNAVTLCSWRQGDEDDVVATWHKQVWLSVVVSRRGCVSSASRNHSMAVKMRNGAHCQMIANMSKSNARKPTVWWNMWLVCKGNVFDAFDSSG